MDVIKRINTIMKERGWSDYRLSLECGLSVSTIANIHRRNTIPSIPTLEAICKAFDISLAQFFSDGEDFVELGPEQKEVFEQWVTLPANQKELILQLITELKQK